MTRPERNQGRMTRRWAGIACLCLLLASCGERNSAPPPNHVKPVPVQHIGTAPGAGVAWFASMRGVTPDGHVLSMAGSPFLNGSSGSWGLRSPDGGHLFSLSSGKLLVASAADGRTIAAVDLQMGWGTSGIPAAVSPDGQSLALAQSGGTTRLILVDLRRGEVVASGSIASTAGSSGVASEVALLAAPDGRLFVVPSTDGHVVLVEPHGSQLEVVARAADSRLSCYSPRPPVIQLAPDQATVIGYCPFDGNVWWFDLSKMRVSAEVGTRIGNPFWGSPAFSSDRRFLYVYDSWDGWVSVVDVARHKLVRSSSVGRLAAAIRLPFVTDAFAKEPNFSASLSADGETLFVTGPHGGAGGVYGIETQSLALRAHWLDGHSISAVWAGGDGLEVYAVDEQGKVLHIIDPSRGFVRTLQLAVTGDFAVP